MELFVRSVYLASALSVAFVLLLYRSNPHRRLPMAPVFVAFSAGLLSVVPVVLLRTVLPLEALSPGGSAVGVAPAIEEAVKFVVFFAIVWRFPFPTLVEPIDVAILFGILGVGFGIYEDFWYIFGTSYDSWVAGDLVRFRQVLRGILYARAFPGHILFDAIAGFLLGAVRFRFRERAGKVLGIAAAFFIAILLHGAFNAVGHWGGTIPLLTYIVALVGVFLALRRREVSRSPFVALKAYVLGASGSWDLPTSPVDLLFAEGFAWPGRSRGGLFQFYPVVFSLVVLFPVLFIAVYLLQRMLLWVV